MRENAVAVVQFCPGTDREANFRKAGELLREAARRGATLAVLPEMFSCFAPATKWRGISERAGGPTETFLAAAAAQQHLQIIGGSYIEDAGDGKYFNTCAIVAEDGGIKARYRKMHLFWTEIPGATRYDERSYLSAGDRQAVFDAGGFRVSVGICYDLRFPEFFRLPGGAPADIFCLPAAFMHTTGTAHWDVLVRSRAIENLAYFAAAGTAGCHYEVADRPGEMVETYGHSMIVSPWGEVLARVDSGEGVAVAAVDREAIVQARSRLGALGHIRGDLWNSPR